MMSILKRLVAVTAAFVVVACGGGGGAGSSPFGGGGGGGTGGGGVVVRQPTISVALSTTTVTAASPATVTATAKDATGAGVVGQVVQFSTTGGLGKFSASSALTDATGTATVSLQPVASSTTGADQVVASTTINGAAVSANAGFQLTATQVTIGSFASDVGTLSAYGQATLTVILANAPALTPVNISLASACVAKGKATLTPSTATTSTGGATFTYRDNGCGATDLTDSLQASITGTAATQSLSLTLTQCPAGSLAIPGGGATPAVMLKPSRAAPPSRGGKLPPSPPRAGPNLRSR